MEGMSSARLQKLIEASRILHAHAHGSFHDRLFQAVSGVFEGTCHGFQFYGIDGSHTLESDAPFPATRRAEIEVRAGELAAAENPLYPHLLNREPEPFRLSDFISQRELKKTHLYHEVLKQADIEYQIALGVYCPAGFGGLTINRGKRDFSDTDLAIVQLLSGHMATAFESSNLLQRLSASIHDSAKIDYTMLRRLGLSRRESEVMVWLVEGKRDAEIATILNISVRTVHQHVGSILTKLGVETRTAAVMTVLQKGAIEAWKRPEK